MQLQLVQAEHQQAAAERQARDLTLPIGQARWQRLLVGLQAQETLASALPRKQVANARQQPEATGTGEQQGLLRVAGKIVRGLSARLELDQRSDRLPVAAPAGQLRDRRRIHASIAAEYQQRIDAAARERAVQRVAGLEGQARRIDLVAFEPARPALQAHDHGDRFVDHLDLGDSPLLGLDQCAALVAVGLGVELDLLDQRALQRGGVVQDVFEPALLDAQFLQLLFDLDGFQAGQLAQADFEDVLGLPVAQAEALDQCGLRLVGRANDANHLVDVEQHQLPAFEHVHAIEYLGQPVLGAPLHRGRAERDPLGQDLAQAFLRRPAVGADHRQVDRRRAFERGVGEQRGDQLLLLHRARLRLEHEAHLGLLARFVAYRVEHRKHAQPQLHLLGGERLLAGLDLRVGQLLDFFEHLLRARTRRQLGDDELPLATRQVFDLPARPHLQAAAARRVGGADVFSTADDLAAAGVVGAGDQRGELVVGELVVADQRHRCGRDLAQVVARHFGGQADRDAARAVEQHERQPCRQLPRLGGRAVVVGNELDRAFVDLVEQQACDRRQPRLGVAHRRGAVAVARAEVALAVDQRVALRKVLRHAHQRVVGGGVAVRVELAQHIADDARALHRFGTARGVERQTHALHRVQDAPLHGLLPIAHVGQRAALDDAEGVFEVRAFGVLRQADGATAVVGG